ncbi:hypothetical protein B0T19DRAFT_413456, partial [Cercophora scortea]
MRGLFGLGALLHLGVRGLYSPAVLAVQNAQRRIACCLFAVCWGAESGVLKMACYYLLSIMRMGVIYGRVWLPAPALLQGLHLITRYLVLWHRSRGTNRALAESVMILGWSL